MNLSRLKHRCSILFTNVLSFVSRKKYCSQHIYIIGAQKSGTTSLHKLLATNSEVEEGFRKELQIFSIYPKLNPDKFYRKSATYFLDSSPYYAIHPLAPRRIARHAAGRKTKIIFVFRDPIERLISHFRHNLKLGLEQRSLAAALTDEMENFDDWEHATAQGKRSKKHQHYSYVHKSLYYWQLKNWLNLPENLEMHTIAFSELNEPAARAKLQKFLGFHISHSALPKTNVNVSTSTIPSQSIPNFIREIIQEDYDKFLSTYS